MRAPGNPLPVLYALTFLFTTMMGTGLPLVPQFLADDLRASVLFIGIVGGTYGLMQIILRLPMGDLSDQVGRRRSLFAAFTFSFAAGVLYVWSPSKEWLIPAHALFGFSSGIFWVSANSFIADHVAPARLARAMSHYSIALGLGFLVGPPLGGVLADAFGYRIGLAVFPAASLLCLLLLLWFPADGPLGVVTMRGRRVHARAMKLLRIGDLAFGAVGIGALAIVFTFYANFYPLWVRGLGFTSFAVGILFGTREILATGSRFFAADVIARIGPRRILVGSLFLGAVSLFAIPFLTTMPLLLFAAAMAGLAMGAIIPANLILTNRAAPPAERGLANGIYGTALGVGSALSPLVFGAVANRFGIPVAFWAGGLTCVLIGVALLLARKRLSNPAPGAEVSAGAQGAVDR